MGEDQRQHLELARALAVRFGPRHRPVFPIPEAALPERAARVMDLQRPTRKMSTSGGTAAGTLFLLDPPETVLRKVSTAVTDAGGEVRQGPDKPGVSNLLSILSAALDEPVAAIEERFRGRGYAALKAEVAEAVVKLTGPIRERYHDLARGGLRPGRRGASGRGGTCSGHRGRPPGRGEGRCRAAGAGRSRLSCSGAARS